MPGSAIVILAATLSVVPAIPAIGLVLVLSIDWFVGMARALGNLIGNCVATVVIEAWEKDLDIALAKRVLAGDLTVDIAEDSLPNRCRSSDQTEPVHHRTRRMDRYFLWSDRYMRPT